MSQHGCPERLSNRTKGFQEEGGSEPTMEVLVETLTGTAFEMTVSPSDTIFAIKSKIFRVEGIPVAQQHLLYNLKELEDSSSLSEHAIGDGARLRLVLGMRGGPISTRRLPQPAPAAAEFWPARIERLLDSNRDDGDWSGGSGAGGGAGGGAGAGCKVTVLVFRDGERVNMLRVKENTDGTYSPIDHAKYSSPLQQQGVTETERPRAPAGDRSTSLAQPPLAPQGADNVLTHAKMADLRRRMDTLSLLRHNRKHAAADMHKTRSEETLPVSASDAACGTYSRNYTFDEDSFAPLYDGNFTRYEYDCSFADRYTLLPPIGTRTDSEQSVGEGSTSELAASVLRKEGSTTELAASVLRKEGRDRRRREPDTLAPISTDLGAVVGGGVEWGAGGGHSASASSLRLAAAGGAEPASAPRAPLASYYSSSTSDLHSTHRVLPALSRHRNRSHLHLSDESLPAVTAAAPVAPADAEPAPARAKRERCCRCRKRLGAATLLRCRCGAACCAEHRYPDTHACRLYPPKPARPL